MVIKNYLLAAGVAISLLPASAHAQTISTFDDITLPGVDTTYAPTQDTGSYTFRSGNAVFDGELTTWGGYSGFNVSDKRDDTTGDFTNDASAITAQGVDSSANYGVCFVPIDINGPNPTATLPVGVKLKDAAVGHEVNGAYITNTTYAYYYMQDNFQAGNWFKLTVHGYLNGQESSDSVTMTLGQVTQDTVATFVNQWTWLDLTPLGNVDSLTFDLASNDTVGGFGMNNPAYFAIDNLTTADSTVNGIHLAETNLAFSVSPNPTATTLQIHNNHPVDAYVYDLSGRLVLQQNRTLSLQVADLPSGAYILDVFDRIDGKRGSLKFVKK